MEIKIDELLSKINKTRYWLCKETGINYQSLSKLCKGETSSISFEILEKLCKALKCTPNDIIHFERF